MAAKESLKQARIIGRKVNKHLHSFHALHSSAKMERLDYAFKFSTELVVITFSLIIIGINAAGADNLEGFNKNLISKFLTYHPKMNLALYSKTTTIKTVVDNQQSTFIPSASAHITLASETLDNKPATLLAAVEDVSLITNNTIEKENLDSVRGLIAEQIKVYDTVSGDTLQSIANKFGISTDTLIWANNLPNNTIKPGWNLVILPTSGVLHKVTNNDTLPDIAKKYSANIEQIISYNNLADDSDIDPGDLLIIPGGIVPTPIKPKPAVKHLVNNKIVYEPSPGGIEDLGNKGHIFPWGQCTYWVAKKFQEKGGYIPWGGNAKNWLANSKAYGAASGMEPVVGAIAVTNENKRYGHVAYVIAVDGDRFKITEMNYKGKGIITERWLNINASVFLGFIYW